MSTKKHTHILVRLAIVDLGLKDLSEAINERLALESRKPIHYTAISRAINGHEHRRSMEALAMADSITYQWVREYARDYLRVLKPRLEEMGIDTDGLLAKTVIDDDHATAVWIRNKYGYHIATYHVPTDKIYLIGE